MDFKSMQHPFTLQSDDYWQEELTKANRAATTGHLWHGDYWNPDGTPGRWHPVVARPAAGAIFEALEPAARLRALTYFQVSQDAGGALEAAGLHPDDWATLAARLPRLDAHSARLCLSVLQLDRAASQPKPAAPTPEPIDQGWLSDADWAALKPHVPNKERANSVDSRYVLDSLLWRLRFKKIWKAFGDSEVRLYKSFTWWARRFHFDNLLASLPEIANLSDRVRREVTQLCREGVKKGAHLRKLDASRQEPHSKPRRRGRVCPSA